MQAQTAPWAVILAGGEGTRLRPLTQRLTGDARPKQFCRLLGSETLLERTRRRADRIIRPDRELGALTARRLAGDVPIAILPSDHDIEDETTFMSAVAQAVGVVATHRDRVIVLGIEPRGCLWNSFVMVGWAEAFLQLIETALPEFIAAFAPVDAALGTRTEGMALARAYATLPTIGFSEGVVTRVPDRLSVMRVKDVGWCDLGNPKRVVGSARRRGHAPSWLAEAASLTA